MKLFMRCKKRKIYFKAGMTVEAAFVLPFFMFAIYEKDGRPLEKILMNMIQVKFKRPGIRPYQTENFYAAIQKEINEKEVLDIGKENERASQKHKKRAGKNKG